MSARGLRVRLDELREAEAAGPQQARAAALEALGSGQGALQARAASLLRKLDAGESAPRLAEALAEQLAGDGQKDGGAVGKLALARALLVFGWTDAALWSAAVRCVQFEPVWGGRVDAAAGLRAVAALGLVRSSAVDAGLELARLLADGEREARAGAVEALREAPSLWALPLLLLASRSERDPALLADLLEGLLERGGLSPDDLREELAGADDERREAAALALAAAGGDEALDLLLEALVEQPLPAARRGLWLGLLGLRGDDSRDRLSDWLRSAGADHRPEAAETAAALGEEDWTRRLDALEGEDRR